MHDMGEFQARVIGTGNMLDLAVLKIDPPQRKALPVAKVGRSMALQVGHCIIAIGYPMNLSKSIAVGFVSSLDHYSTPIPDKRFSLIQASIPLSNGNSGGPLVTRHGEVVGIASASIENAQAIGFVIPIDFAMHVAARISKGRSMCYPFVGLETDCVSREMARQKALTSTRGALIIRTLPGSPSAICGLRRHDVIVAIDGKLIESSKDAVRMFETFLLGRSCRFKQSEIKLKIPLTAL